MPTELNARLIAGLSAEITEIDGVSVRLYTEAGYRFVLVLEGQGLGGSVSESDPGRVGERPLPVRPKSEDVADGRTAAVMTAFIDLAAKVLRDLPEARQADPQANGVLLRGIGKKPSFSKSSMATR